MKELLWNMYQLIANPHIHFYNAPCMLFMYHDRCPNSSPACQNAATHIIWIFRHTDGRHPSWKKQWMSRGKCGGVQMFWNTVLLSILVPSSGTGKFCNISRYEIPIMVTCKEMVCAIVSCLWDCTAHTAPANLSTNVKHSYTAKEVTVLFYILEHFRTNLMPLPAPASTSKV